MMLMKDDSCRGELPAPSRSVPDTLAQVREVQSLLSGSILDPTCKMLQHQSYGVSTTTGLSLGSNSKLLCEFLFEFLPVLLALNIMMWVGPQTPASPSGCIFLFVFCFFPFSRTHMLRVRLSLPISSGNPRLAALPCPAVHSPCLGQRQPHSQYILGENSCTAS